MFAVSAARTNAGIRERQMQRAAKFEPVAEQLNQKIAALQQRVAKYEAQIDALTNDLAGRDVEIARLHAVERFYEMARMDVRQIVRKAAECHGIDVGEINGQSRARPIVECRHDAVAAARWARPDLSLPALGRLFGNRDHTTILNSCRLRGYDKGWHGRPAFGNAEFAAWVFQTFDQLIDE